MHLSKKLGGCDFPKPVVVVNSLAQVLRSNDYCSMMLHTNPTWIDQAFVQSPRASAATQPARSYKRPTRDSPEFDSGL